MRTPLPKPWMIWWAIGLHMIWGASLIARPVLTSVSVLVGLDRVTSQVGLSSQWLGTILLIAAILAALGLLLEKFLPPRISLLLLAPQYLLLLAACFSDLITIEAGSVNGRSVDRVILFAVLWPIMLAAVFHSAAIYERYTHQWTSTD